MSIEERAERLTRTLVAALSPFPVEEVAPLWVDEVAEALRAAYQAGYQDGVAAGYAEAVTGDGP